jgi:hypothetical protein
MEGKLTTDELEALGLTTAADLVMDEVLPFEQIKTRYQDVHLSSLDLLIAADRVMDTGKFLNYLNELVDRMERGELGYSTLGWEGLGGHAEDGDVPELREQGAQDAQAAERGVPVHPLQPEGRG